jgi:SAM-dependent methyltransferase
MQAFRVQIKRALGRWPHLKAAAFLLDDLRWGIRLSLGRIDTTSGTTHSTISLEQSLRYIEEVFHDYKRYGGLARFQGVVAEVGPGDNAGVALLMRNDGCQHVHLIDRYSSRRDPAKQSLIYEALSKRHELDWLKRGARWDDNDLTGVEHKIGRSAEDYFDSTSGSSADFYDAIVSRSVMEHLYDPLGALGSMAACLKAGGRMIHKVDLRDHEMFTPEQHELTFLRFPQPFYRLMTRNSGRPNRVLFHRYRDRLERLQKERVVKYQLLITRLAGVGDVVPHLRPEQILDDVWRRAERFVDDSRKRFAAEFSGVSSRDLAVSGFFLVATRT